MSTSDCCPVCDPPSSCKCYPHLWANLRADPAKWRKIHDRRNAMPPIDDLMVMDIILATMAPDAPTGDEPGAPTGRRCCG